MERVYAPAMGSRWVRASVSAALCASTACIAEPPTARCNEDEELAVAVESSSDAPALCSTCEPGCYLTIDTIRSADVEARGSGGLTFSPELAGATSSAQLMPCDDFPCVDEWEYVDGASYERIYAAYDPGLCNPLNEAPLWSDLAWAATIPEGTSITLEIRTGNSLSDARMRPIRTVEITGASESPLFLARVLVEMGLTSAEVYAAYVIVRAVLHPSADRRRAPTLRGLSLEMYCQTGGL